MRLHRWGNAERPPPRTNRDAAMTKLYAAVYLPLRFAWALVISGFQTLQFIWAQGLSVGRPSMASFVRMGFAPMDERGATLMACMICLTPGTTVIDIDMDRHEMVVHMLDTSDIQAAVEGIRRDFETPLLAWFGVGA